MEFIYGSLIVSILAIVTMLGTYDVTYDKFNGRRLIKADAKFKKEFYACCVTTFIPIFNLLIICYAFDNFDRRIFLVQAKPLIYFLPILSIGLLWLL